MGFLGGLQKMKILAYEVGNFKTPTDEFSVYINPDKYSHSFQICYNDVQAQGAPGGSPNFNKVLSETVKFELVFDGTGVIPSALPGVLPFLGDGITKQIADFKKVVYNYEGEIHSPRYIELVWGTLMFTCRLSTLSLTYTMFKPDGTPLRARADATFISYKDETELALSSDPKSPDLSKVLTVTAGDTLPLMCYGVYGSSMYYPQIAEVNGLTDFRDLVVGARLLFPPLGDAIA